MLFNASPWGGARGVQETLDYVATAFGDIVSGRDIQKQNLPSIDLLCNHILKVRSTVCKIE